MLFLSRRIVRVELSCLTVSAQLLLRRTSALAALAIFCF